MLKIVLELHNLFIQVANLLLEVERPFTQDVRTGSHDRVLVLETASCRVRFVVAIACLTALSVGLGPALPAS
jgi:hypothetical protein